MTALLAALLAVVAFVLGWRLRGRRSPVDRRDVPPPALNAAAPAPPGAATSPLGAGAGWSGRSDGRAPDAGAAIMVTDRHGTGSPQGLSTPLSSAAGDPIPVDPPQQRIGRYRLERELGRGSMGRVHLARGPEAEAPPVALKTMALAREFGGAELAEARARFFREADVAARLRHPDIVRVLDAGEDGGIAYIAMEFVPGESLARHTLPGTLLPVPVVLESLARVAAALAHAHRQGVIHRDLKPANVMLDLAAETVKVTDFGIAHVADACRTRTGLVLGTPSFMSPEQMTGARVDGRSDIYALGVMLYQLLTGALPHASDSMAELLRAIVNEPAPDVRRARPDLSAAVAAVVARALAKPPDERYPDADELARDLRAAAAPVVAVDV